MKPKDIIHAVLRLPYILAYAKVKFLSRLLWGIKVWPRHSYLTEAFIPLRSDLDLSAYVTNSESIASFLKFYYFLKKIVPLLGEMHIYTPECIYILREHDFNGFDLERDPLLLAKFNLSLTQNKCFDSEKAISYLLMSLMSDLHKLRKNPGARLKKWKYHFEHVKAKLRTLSIDVEYLDLDESKLVFSIVTGITNLSRPKSSNEAMILRSRLWLNSGFIPGVSDTDRFLDLMGPSITQENVDVFCYFIEYLAHIPSKPEFVSEKQFKILMSQLDWVLFRYLKQNYSKASADFALAEIKVFRKIVEEFSSKNPLFEVFQGLKKMDSVAGVLQKRLAGFN